MLTGYFATYGLQKLTAKLAERRRCSSIHACWIVFPALRPAAAILAWRKRRDPDTRFLLAWIGIFFAGALVVFFAGSARYLLPDGRARRDPRLPPPRNGSRPLSPSNSRSASRLAAANYQHWDGYRTFAAALRAPSAGHRVWIDGDWGLRYYFESDHGLPARKGQHLRPGDFVVSSELGSNVEFNAPLSRLADADIRPSVPFRIFGLESHSGYSTVEEGFLPFDISTDPSTASHARMVWSAIPRSNTCRSMRPSHRPDRQRHLSQGSLDVADRHRRPEDPAVPMTLRAEFYIPPNAPARHVRFCSTAAKSPSHTYPGPGAYKLTSAGAAPGLHRRSPRRPDLHRARRSRALGMVLLGVGFAQ